MTNYKVIKGDTLAAIAKKFSVSVSALVRANDLKDANKIRAGKTITIPDNGWDAAVEGEILPASLPVVVTQNSESVNLASKLELADWFKAPRVYWLVAAVGITIYMAVNSRDDE